MARMPIADLQAILQSEKSDALSGMNATKLGQDRADAMDYYLGDMARDMPALPDRSKAVSTDVADTVEGLMPWMMDILAGGEEVVRFEPVGIEDEEAAAQETDYVNHVFMQKNPGFLIIYEMVKDAMISKTGIAKVYWEKVESEESETYLNLGEDAYGLIVSEPSITVTEHTANDDGTHDVTVVTKSTYQCAKVEAVPPEEFGISRRAKNISECGYCFHETTEMQADLIANGYDAKQIKRLPTGTTDTSGTEKQARDTVEETNDQGDGGAFKNDANRPIKTTEHYIRVDYEGNGKARLYRIKTAGEIDKPLILRLNGKPDIEPIDFMPFAAMTPIIMPHRFFGRSIADLVMDIQRMKTALMRSLLDNIYLANNQRLEIAESHAGPHTVDDMLNNRPGGIIRTKQPGGLMPVPNQEIGSFAYPMVEYLDATREWRTGVTRQGQGIDANTLQNQTAEAVSKIYSAAQARMKLIARIFAETGIRDMFSILHATIRKNDRQSNTVKLRNKWVTVNPRDWKTRDDMTINVGLGNGTKDQQMAFLITLLGLQKEAIMVPQMQLVEPSNIYNSLKKVVELGGLKSVEPYFTDPKAIDPKTGQPKQPPPPAPDPKMVEVQANIQIEQAKLQASAQQAERDGQIKQAEMQGKMALEKLQAEADIATQNRKTQAELVLAERRFELERELKLLDASIKKEQHGQALALNAQKAEMTAKKSGKPGEKAESLPAPEPQPNKEAAEIAAQVKALAVAIGRPRKILRDKAGKAQGLV